MMALRCFGKAWLVAFTAAAFVAAGDDAAKSPELKRESVDKQFRAMAGPLLKIEYHLTPEAKALVARKTIPKQLLKRKRDDLLVDHAGSLYFTVRGEGKGHVVDLTDQPSQGCQVDRFIDGDVTVKGAWMTFIAAIGETARVHVEGGPGYGILAPMMEGPGCQHLEFGGTHIILPKVETPVVAHMPATATEIAKLRDQKLTRKILVKFQRAEHTIYALPNVQFVPGDHAERKAKFPDIYGLIELDRTRQVTATSVSAQEVRQALQADDK